VHFTQAYASWLNQVEIWFNRINSENDSAKNLPQCEGTGVKTDQFVRAEKTTARPFAWTATAGSIFAKVQRRYERIPGTGQGVQSIRAKALY